MLCLELPKYIALLFTFQNYIWMTLKHNSNLLSFTYREPLSKKKKKRKETRSPFKNTHQPLNSLERS